MNIKTCLKFHHLGIDTVDGRNPAPPRMMIIPLFIGFYTSQVVQGFVHQPYVSLEPKGSRLHCAVWPSFSVHPQKSPSSERLMDRFDLPSGGGFRWFRQVGLEVRGKPGENGPFPNNQPGLGYICQGFFSLILMVNLRYI